MADLLVRGLDDALVQRLREQAAAHGNSVVAEHRLILSAALSEPQPQPQPQTQPRKISIAEALSQMPDADLGSDFAQPDATEPHDQDARRVARVTFTYR